MYLFFFKHRLWILARTASLFIVNDMGLQWLMENDICPMNIKGCDCVLHFTDHKSGIINSKKGILCYRLIEGSNMISIH